MIETTTLMTIAWAMMIVAYLVLYFEHRALKKRYAELEKQPRVVRREPGFLELSTLPSDLTSTDVLYEEPRFMTENAASRP